MADEDISNSRRFSRFLSNQRPQLRKCQLLSFQYPEPENTLYLLTRAQTSVMVAGPIGDLSGPQFPHPDTKHPSEANHRRQDSRENKHEILSGMDLDP